MWKNGSKQKWWECAAAIVGVWLTVLLTSATASAITKIPSPPPAPGSYGLAATKTQPPPKDAVTISTPGNGASFSTIPITVGGLCTTNLLVQVYDNDALAGATVCSGDSFKLQISLFPGTNDLTATQYDDLGQASPASNKVSVTYSNAHFSAFGSLLTLTSDYGRRAADPGATLTWPLQLSGGTGPYAFSIDWGDGGKAQLMSQSVAGVVNISHVYNQSGVYPVTITVTDTNGVSAFLQLVAVANGKPNPSLASTNSKSGTGTPTATPKILWLPTAAGAVLLFPAYWLGRRSELLHLHNKLERDLQKYREE